MSDLLLDVKVRTVEGAVRGGERACGVRVRQIMAVAYQAVTAAALSATRRGRRREPRRTQSLRRCLIQQVEVHPGVSLGEQGTEPWLRLFCTSEP
jgi:hypothetical protein